jgi:hypothetical protein
MHRTKTSDRRPPVFGLAARYDSEERFLEAVNRTMEAGYRSFEIYSPFSIQGLRTIRGHRTGIQWVVFFGGVFGGLGGFIMQYIANVRAYQLNIGGRPFNSWPAFIPITFEMTILFAALAGFIGFLISCRLPEVYHPMFNVPGFDRVSIDAFFICITADDGKYDTELTRRFLEGTNADEVHPVNY